jgi:hypothetical protein
MQALQLPPLRSPSDAGARALTKATLRSAELLGLTNAALAEIVGLSESTVSRMGSGKTFDVGSKPAELAALLVRLYRSLDALVGNNDAQRRQWMNSHNDAFHATPRAVIRSAEGLVRVVTYLDGARALS